MSNIKINDVYQRIQYAATTGQTQFSIPFPFFQNNYVYVWQDGVQLDIGAAPGEYGITGAGSPSGGEIVLVTPADQDSIITIEGVMPIDRTSIYSATISNLTGSDLNGDFNREVVMMKQIQTVQELLQLSYAPWTVISQDVDVTTDRFIPLLPALGAWRMNAAHTAIETFQTPASGGLAPDDAEYLLQTANADLPNAIPLDEVASGYMVNQFGTGLAATRIFQGVANQTVVTNGNGVSGNTIYGIAENPTLPGTAYFNPPIGTTAQRPVSPVIGMTRYNTTLQMLEAFNGVGWEGAAGGGIDSVVGTANQIDVDSTDPQNPVLSLSPILDAPGTFTIQASTDIDEIIDDNTFATASATNIATALSTKNYIDGLDVGSVKSVTGTANEIDADNTDPQNPILSLSSTLDTPGTFTVQGTIAIDAIIDDDTFATATDSNVPTAESVKAYVDAQPGGGGFTSVVEQVFTSSGTYTPTANMLYCNVRAVGGGGGGSPQHSPTYGGSGGGAGGYSESAFSAATIGISQSVTIGAGGSATPTSGGNTTFGSLLTANGGAGGGAAGSGGGAGGSATGGSLNIVGGAGMAAYGGSPANNAFGGDGGSSPLGQGGAGARNYAGVGPTTASAGGSYGGGGGGGALGNGAAGANGIIIVTEYIG